ncbi:MAG: hypothetical protein LRZ84_24030 [Desertifilum sp.]|nr:hypothetical protein [Desertifilum sp.]
MERGLLWLPLLIAFFGLAWAGWNDYQKVEAYRQWAMQFDRAKYDIYAVLGQKGSELTWGKPTRQGPVDLETFSLNNVQGIRLLGDRHPLDWNSELNGSFKQVALEFILPTPEASIQVPFTELSLAAEWGKFLQQEWQRYQSQKAV